VDGLSTDKTVEVLAARRDAINVLISEKDSGIYNALNKGMRSCTGDVVGFLHADDVLANPTVLGQIARAFGDPSVDVVYGDLLYVSKTNVQQKVRYWRAGAFSRAELGKGWMPPHPTMYVRRALYERIGGFDESYRIAADYDCVLRVFKRENLRAAYIPEVLVKMRVGGISNGSLTSIVRKSAEDYRALRRNGVGGALTLLVKNLRKIRQFVEAPR